VIIVRGEEPRGWSSIPNALLEDGTLSLRARGLLSYLLSRPEGWETDSDRLARSVHARKDGRDAIRTALDELVVAGYIVRNRQQDARGRWTSTSFVYHEPVPAEARSGSLRGRRVEKPVDNTVDGL
jgi:hypothetical protein